MQALLSAMAINLCSPVNNSVMLVSSKNIIYIHCYYDIAMKDDDVDATAFFAARHSFICALCYGDKQDGVPPKINHHVW